MIVGYKCFKKGMVNHYGEHFEIGKTYSVLGPIKFGTNGNGYHMCTNMEDTLRYFHFDEDIDMCKVIGDGKFAEFNDEYYGYYFMYAVERLHIEKKLSREEIVAMALKMYPESAIRFIQGIKLTPLEIELFKNQFANDIRVLNAIEYYQERDKDIYERTLCLK
ncbi:MAG: hypothetical protein IJN03_01045 [Bacilli bacterium]|nr:hypothetical protein [Bacilli bacterium]